ncbi:ISL3 family transposase [Streptomyces sp. CoH27]|uniref:ISL3 family transposase n=1 Tax=Streptomyces sp. CoH27 TaxID=2875763 RepID=UPI001CD359F9
MCDSSGILVVEAVSTARPGRCPNCRKQARRVHSTYQRALDERPLGSHRVIVRLRVRRYFCDRKSCSRTTFVEQVPGLSTRYRRSSTGLACWLRSIAIEPGGRPPARLRRRLRLTAGRTRLLRLLTAPTIPDRAPRVLGVDEFAFRKGCTYGTVLVDVEADRVVDVLPDRTSETFAAWLTEHPGAEVICRDRATAYTKAVEEAAPHALEVADRWHLLQNLSAAVERTCHQHRDCLRKHTNEKTVTEVPETPPMLLPPAELPRTPDHRTHPPPLRGHPPPAGETLDDQRHRPPAEPRPQDRPPLPRHRPRPAAGLRPRPPPQRRPGALQGIPQRSLHRGARPDQRHPAVPGDPGSRLPRQPPGRPQTPRRPPRGHRRTGPGRHPEPAQDHLVDHAAPGDAHRKPGRTPPSGPARPPGRHPGLRPRPGLRRSRVRLQTDLAQSRNEARETAAS